MKKNGPAFEANGIADAVGDFTEDLENIVEIQTCIGAVWAKADSSAQTSTGFMRLPR